MKKGFIFGQLFRKLINSIVDIKLLSRVLSLVQPFKRIFYLATFLAVSLAFLAPIRPRLIQLAVDGPIPNKDFEGLVWMIVLLVGALSIEAVFRYLFIFNSNLLGQSIIRDLRAKVFRHVVKMKLQYFDTTPIGTSTTRTINDVETINDIFAVGIINIIADILTILVILAYMFYLNWQLSLVCLTTFPLFVYCTYLFKEGIKSSFQVVRNQVAVMNAFLQERISGMNIIQIFSAEEKELKTFKEINGKYKGAQIKAIWYYAIFFPAIEIILATATGLLVWYGANMTLNGQSSLGTLIAFILYLNMLFRPLRMLADKFNTLQMGLIASERVFNLLDDKLFIEDKGTKRLTETKGNIAFENVSFAYNEKDLVLKNVSFNIKSGETLAIVGATGAGKSSVINVLNRFYEIQKGKITIDGVDIKDVQLDSLRSNIGLVLQDVFLFSGSVMENITLSDMTIQKEKVIEAARLVGASEFIDRLPGKYDFDVRERGVSLSLGQRQLISFIRTLVFDPKILILDEATSSVDTETEQLIQNATATLIKDRTSIVIAHRLSTIRHADNIMVLDKGQIVEFGNHSQLMDQQGYYHQLIEMQQAQEKAKIEQF